jgi:hypothetical protein
MLRRLRRHMTYANVTATLALFFALAGGSAYAVNEWDGSNIQDETLTGADVRDETIAGTDITNESIASEDIDDFSIRGGDMALNTLTGSTIQNGSLTGDQISNSSLTGSDVATGSIQGIDLRDNNVGGEDVRDNSIAGEDIRDASLNDEDVGQGTFVNFAATIGAFVPHECKALPITGIDAQGDHMLLTPSAYDADKDVDYSIRYTNGDFGNNGRAILVACNKGGFYNDDRTTHFNLLVIDAQ